MQVAYVPAPDEATSPPLKWLKIGYDPAGTSLHNLPGFSLMPPVLPEYFPIGHKEQLEEPSLIATEPGEQRVGALKPDPV